MAGINIEAGFPVIDAANSGQFIPQRPTSRRWAVSALRKAAIPDRDGGASKIPWCQQTRALVADGSASRLPEAGEDLELKMGENGVAPVRCWLR